MEILNRKAKHDYFIINEYEAGISLLATEIKSIKKGSANISDSFGKVKNGEIFLLNMYIAPYEEGNIFNHEERRDRKLLLHKKEILKINEQVTLKRYPIIPLKLYDKRQSIKEKEIKRNKEIY